MYQPRVFAQNRPIFDHCEFYLKVTQIVAKAVKNRFMRALEPFQTVWSDFQDLPKSTIYACTIFESLLFGLFGGFGRNQNNCKSLCLVDSGDRDQRLVPGWFYSRQNEPALRNPPGCSHLLGGGGRIGGRFAVSGEEADQGLHPDGLHVQENSAAGRVHVSAHLRPGRELLQRQLQRHPAPVRDEQPDEVIEPQRLQGRTGLNLHGKHGEALR